MSDNDNRDFLVKELTSIKSLNGRYENIKCVNWPPKPGEDKKGFFSLVFKAFDTTSGRDVAIKVLDPCHLGNAYRVDCFNREPFILKQLSGKKRCLQLVDGMNNQSIKVQIAPGSSFDFPCGYFVSEWLSHDIEDYFLNKDSFDAKLKLVVFRNIVSAVEAIHNCNIFHRDLKPDNMKADSQDVSNRVIVVIDFGTAAQYASGKLLNEYTFQVGHSAYSAPETFLGFAGERDIAKYTDIYALGCMLYELFNDSLFVQDLVSTTNYQLVLTSLGYKISTYPTMEEKIKCFHKEIVNLSKMVVPPDIAGSTSTMPVSISNVIRHLFNGLVKFDFKNRLSNFETIRSRIDIAIRILDNQEHQKRVMDRKKLYKQKTIEKLLRQDSRLNTFVSKTKSIPC